MSDLGTWQSQPVSESNLTQCQKINLIVLPGGQLTDLLPGMKFSVMHSNLWHASAQA